MAGNTPKKSFDGINNQISCYTIHMLYYAVGYGSWTTCGYRDATEEERQKWREDNPDKEEPPKLFVRNLIMDGSSAKAAGPFKTAKQAWAAATELQSGASMMANPPFVFKSKSLIKPSVIAKKVDRDDILVKSEYQGKDCIHDVVLIRRFERDLAYVSACGRLRDIYYRGTVPSSRLKRCRIINKERCKNA